jgi:hypothetical protein
MTDGDSPGRRSEPNASKDAGSQKSFVHRLADRTSWDAPPRTAWKHFAIAVLAWALVGLLVYGAGAAAVNPRGEFPWQLVQPISSEDPAYKLWLLEHQPATPEVLILGSSRSQKVAPADVERVSGSTAFNFALADAYPEDALKVYRGVGDDVRPREIIVGLDLNRLEPREDASQRTRYAFGPLHDDPSPNDWADAFARTYTDLYARQAGGAVLEAVGVADAGLVDFDDDGLAHYVPWETAQRRGTFDQDATIDAFLGGRSGYRPFRGLDEAHAQAVRDLVDEARADGVTVRVWLSPVHPRVEASYGNMSFPQYEAAARDLLVSLCAPGVHAHDLTDLATFGGRPEWFFDGSHMMQENTALVVEALYSGAGDLCAPSPA